MSRGPHVIGSERLRELGRGILTAADAPPDIAAVVIDHLVEANLAGHDSHGVIVIPRYLDEIRRGYLAPEARPRIVRETGSTALVDARRGFGHHAALFATDLGVRKAREAGVSLVGVVECGHIGRLGTYASRAAEQGAVSFIANGGLSPHVVPFGGKKAAVGTNPVAFGFPADRGPDFMADFATSSVAGNKLLVARAKGESVPPGLLLDKEGNPTTNPADFWDGGGLLPFGGHKGYALGLVSALLASVLTGALETAYDWGVCILSIDAGVFRPATEVRQAADRAFARVKSTPPAEGSAGVMIPGEPELATRERRLRDGIPLDDDTWAGLAAAAARLGIPLDR